MTPSNFTEDQSLFFLPLPGTSLTQEEIEIAKNDYAIYAKKVSNARAFVDSMVGYQLSQISFIKAKIFEPDLLSSMRNTLFNLFSAISDEAFRRDEHAKSLETYAGIAAVQKVYMPSPNFLFQKYPTVPSLPQATIDEAIQLASDYINFGALSLEPQAPIVTIEPEPVPAYEPAPVVIETPVFAASPEPTPLPDELSEVAIIPEPTPAPYAPPLVLDLPNPDILMNPESLPDAVSLSLPLPQEKSTNPLLFIAAGIGLFMVLK